MRIALVAPPFLCVPPRKYGGTELFIAQLAVGLRGSGHEVVVYTNGKSTVDVERRFLYENSEWPIRGEIHANLSDVNHTGWAVADARSHCDIIHLNNAPGLVHTRFIDTPVVYTIHHPHDGALSEFYGYYPGVHYVTISEFQRRKEKLPHIRTIHHGLDFSRYQWKTKKQPYLAFIGRIAPVKGTHIAIAAAKAAGMPLKIAGEVQPMFRSYFQREIEPHIDGRNVEYIGDADLAAKNELLGNASAMLFPIQWDEPFGLVMIEAMACGTPVLAFRGGSVSEIVEEGVSGFICNSVGEMGARVSDAALLEPAKIRAYVERGFSVDTMVARYESLYREILATPAQGKSRAIA